MHLRSIQLSRRGKIVAALIIIVLPALIYWQVWGFARVSADTGGYLANVRDILSLHLPSDMHRVPLGSLAALATGVTTKEDNTRWLLLVQLLMHGCVAVITVYIVANLGLPMCVAAITAAVLWLPPYVDHAGFVLSESSAEFCLAITLLGLYLLIAERSTGGGGSPGSCAPLPRSPGQRFKPFRQYSC